MFSLLGRIFNKRKRKDNDMFSNVTDNIIEIKDIIPNQILNTGNKIKSNISKTYTCLRDYQGTCIYIVQNELDKFESIEFACTKKKKDDKEVLIVNLTNILKFTIDQDVIPIVASSVPQDVQIKFIRKCRIRQMNVYIVRFVKLDPSDQLFNDLINLKIFKDKHNLK